MSDKINPQTGGPADTGANGDIPDSLRTAVRAAEETGRQAQEKAMFAMPFRARLRARETVRPRTTMSILSKVDPSSDTFTPGGAPEALTPPPPMPGNRTPLAMTGTTPPAATIAGAAPTAIPAAFPSTPDRRDPPPGDGDDDDAAAVGGLRGRLGDMSQFAFAGLAVLGLAGLSVIAAEGALNSKGPGATDTDPNADPFVSTASTQPITSSGASGASVITADAASLGAAQPATADWFDYRGVGDLLRTRKADADRLLAEAAAADLARRTEDEKRDAALIADSEAKRLADLEASQTAQAATAAANAEAERVRLAEAEAQRVADAAAATKAADDARRAETARLEARRVADAEAARKAKADAEAARVAAQKVERAAAEKARLAELERQRLAALEAEQAAARTRQAALKSSGRGPVQMEAHDGAIPKSASLKPAKPPVLTASFAPAASAASTSSTTTVTRTYTRTYTRPYGSEPIRIASASASTYASPLVTRSAPDALIASAPSVRALSDPRTVPDFISERVQRTSSSRLSDSDLVAMRAEVLRVLDTGSDGSRHTIRTPDGRDMNLLLESSQPKEWTVTSVRYLGAAGLDSANGETALRYVSEPAPQTLSIMCRDVAYAFPGQESGRFAACKTPDGSWTMARASEAPRTPV